MSARQSAATDRALRLVARGVPAPEAARRAKIAYTTLWRAIKRQNAAATAIDGLQRINPPQPTATGKGEA